MSLMQTSNNTVDYRTLSDIRLRKAQLLADISRDSRHVERIWNGLFHSPRQKQPAKRRMSSLLATGAGVVDGALFAWKLYRKLGGKKGFRLF